MAVDITKPITRVCNLCNDRFTGNREQWIEHGNTHHPDHFLQGYSGASTPNPTFSPKVHYFPEIDQWFANNKYLARALKENGWTNEKYYLKYGSTYMKDKWEENSNDDVLGNARNTNTCLHCNKGVKFNEQKWTYPAFCGFKCSTKWYADNTDRIDRAMQTLKERKEEDPNHHLRPNQLQYWINRGYTEEEAKELVRQRNDVNTLEKYIERANGDVEAGTKAWTERTERWLASLKKSGMYAGYSKVGVRLFDEVSKYVSDLHYGNKEVSIKCKNGKVANVDCVHKDKKKVIEFFGDYWHANPKVYKADDLIKVKNKLAREIWRMDLDRIELLEERGYEVLIVWESDFYKDEGVVIQACVKFLNS